MTTLNWGWDDAPPTQGDYGNSNSWAIRAGIDALPRESGQNSVDARLTDQPGSMKFTILRLAGDARSSFEEASGWNRGLRQHIEAMANGGQVVSDRLAAALEHRQQSDELLLLRIADYGCRGLTGPEMPANGVPEDAYGNFIKLCRLDLFSGKELAAGGSFGLGKAVYWRYSRTQTVLFNSTIHDTSGPAGQSQNRVFGVNQGTVHAIEGKRYLGKGWLGRPDDDGYLVSQFLSDDETRALHLEREENAPGTTALIIGFHDPDNPERDAGQLQASIEEGIEENFWPLITRGRMQFTVETIDVESGEQSEVSVEPSRRFTELTHALEVFDDGKPVDVLENVGDVAIRDITIRVPRRKTAPIHDSFEHHAKLVVTRSDDQPDSLENKICLFRGPEMVVETIADDIPDVTFHAFLAAGLAIAPGSDDEDLCRADDFLRLAEPPSHDHWIPGGHSGGHSLGPNYATPYLPGLRDIRAQVKDQLRDIFGVTPPTDDKPPAAIARHLSILAGGPGPAEGRITKPVATLTAWEIDDEGAWNVELSVEMKARPEGWMFRPEVVFVGADAGMTRVEWSELKPVSGCAINGPEVVVSGRPSGRARCRLKGRTDPSSHPIPAHLSAIDVRAAGPRHARDIDGAD